MGKRIAIVQSNYIPWKGYFDLIQSVDEFILFDDMQYTRRDWRNRNKIKTPKGVEWLTIPVQVKGKYYQKINETRVSDENWAERHWKTIQTYYAKSHFFSDYSDFLKELYLGCKETLLSKINYHFLLNICELLNINTQLTWSHDYGIIDGKTERLVDLCQKAGATEYLSGPSAQSYIDSQLFIDSHIKLTFMSYDHYPEYTQIYPPFEHFVSIVDLILNTGPDAKKYMQFP